MAAPYAPVTRRSAAAAASPRALTPRDSPTRIPNARIWSSTARARATEWRSSLNAWADCPSSSSEPTGSEQEAGSQRLRSPV